jgi:hypothetical protein
MTEDKWRRFLSCAVASMPEPVVDPLHTENLSEVSDRIKRRWWLAEQKLREKESAA